MLQRETKADADGLVDLLDVGERQVADLAVKAGFVNGADLRKQNGGVLFQPGYATGQMHVDWILLREALGRERCHDDGGCGFVADVVLNHHDRSAARLF